MLVWDRIEGALSVSGSERFIIRRNRGFSVPVEHDDCRLSGGDQDRGLAALPGPHEIEVVGEIALDVTVHD